MTYVHEPLCGWQYLHVSCSCSAIRAERKRIRDGVLAYYKVAPKAAEPILRIIDEETS